MKQDVFREFSFSIGDEVCHRTARTRMYLVIERRIIDDGTVEPGKQYRIVSIGPEPFDLNVDEYEIEAYDESNKFKEA